MASFNYIDKDSNGNEFSGVYTDIDSAGALRAELEKMGYALVKARRQDSAARKKSGKIKHTEIVAFAYEFAGMYSAGLSIVRCLETFEEQTENPALRSVVSDVRQHVETGSTLKDAFEKYRSVFSDFFLGMVEAGEAGGKLGETLQMAATYLEKQDDLKRKVRAAFAYPIVVGLMCLLIVTILVIFVIPVFQKLYGQLHITLPGPTLLLIAISNVVRHYWWITLLAVSLIGYLGRKLYRNPVIKAKIDFFKLNMPVFGRLNRMVIVSRFVRTFAMMSSAGVSVVEALGVARQVANNNEMCKIAETIEKDIVTGSTLAGPMSRYSIFPPIIIQLAAAGEEAGILPEMLTKGVDFLDSYIDRVVKSLLIKIEPALSVVMGAVVGSILLGVYLPMFDYMGHVK
ncbi:MAG TPA: type II secretion system F family protein, partial [Planctomycetes bacterium]|nr:type II secretion system F family protein [Planctomycetota bacterium]